MEQWSSWADFIQVAYFIIAFDTELNMEGIFTFLENSIGHYAPQIIQAFRAISDDNDADILEGFRNHIFPKREKENTELLQRQAGEEKERGGIHEESGAVF